MFFPLRSRHSTTSVYQSPKAIYAQLQWYAGYFSLVREVDLAMNPFEGTETSGQVTHGASGQQCLVTRAAELIECRQR